jgi:hypothetical protein
MAKSKRRKTRLRGAASPTSPRRVRAAAKQSQAMQLREAGVSFEKIAETLGYRNRSSARKAVLAGLKAARLEPAKILRQLEVRRLDKLWLPLWALAVATPPDFAAIDRLLKIMQRRAALLGLDLKKLALTNPTGDAGAKLININWSVLITPQENEVDPIEEMINRVKATTAADAPGQTASSGGG